MSLLIRVCHLSKITVVFYHVLWERQGCHSSLGCVICQNHSYVLSCIVGETGVSLLIRVCHLSKITVMFYHVLWERQGCHSSLGCVICQKSQLCFIMYCGRGRGVTPH